MPNEGVGRHPQPRWDDVIDIEGGGRGLQTILAGIARLQAYYRADLSVVLVMDLSPHEGGDAMCERRVRGWRVRQQHLSN